jgi:drug/metabolite transporter (DMT)-like permease
VLFQLSYIPTDGRASSEDGGPAGMVARGPAGTGCPDWCDPGPKAGPGNYARTMPFGLLTGHSAALAWGTLDLITALGSRVIGSLRVTAAMQLVTAVLFLAIFLGTGATVPTEPRSLGLAVLLGLIGAGAYLAYFTGLQVGPIAVVSGMVAAFGGLTVVLSVLLRGETLTLLQAAGATIATVGVLLTGIAFDGGLRATRFAGPGVVFAVVALVLFSLMAITTDVALETMSWVQVYTVARVVNATIGLLAVAILARTAHSIGHRPVGGPAWSDARVVGALVIAGTLDVIGLIAFATGLESAPTWMVGLAASFGPAVTIIVAVALLGERLKPVQWLGLTGILAGMVCIAIP